MTMQPFDKRKRDPFLQEDTYLEYVKIYTGLLPNNDFPENRTKMEAKNPDHARKKSFYRANQIFQNIWIDYSAGEPIEAIRKKVPYMYEDFDRHFKAFPTRVFKLDQPDGYYYALTWLSWAVMFNMLQYVPMINLFINHDPKGGHDALMHGLFAALGVPDFPGKGEPLLHPKPYAILLEGLKENKEGQQKAMNKYLRNWYKSMKDCYWYDWHTEAAHAHLGYWAFETGMLTVLNNLDDSSYRDLNFYPRDLVDYCREHGWADEIHQKLLNKG